MSSDRQATVIDPHVHRRRREELAALTAAELQVLGLLARGLDNQAIATTLSLPRPVVSRNVSAIYRKLELRPTRPSTGAFSPPAATSRASKLMKIRAGTDEDPCWHR